MTQQQRLQKSVYTLSTHVHFSQFTRARVSSFYIHARLTVMHNIRALRLTDSDQPSSGGVLLFIGHAWHSRAPAKTNNRYMATRESSDRKIYRVERTGPGHDPVATSQGLREPRSLVEINKRVRS